MAAVRCGHGAAHPAMAGKVVEEPFRCAIRKVAVIVNDALKALDSTCPGSTRVTAPAARLPLERLLRAAAGPDPFLGRLH